MKLKDSEGHNEIQTKLSQTKTFVKSKGSVCPVLEQPNCCANKDGRMRFFNNNDHVPRKFLDYPKKDGGGMQYFYKSHPLDVSANEL